MTRGVFGATGTSGKPVRDRPLSETEFEKLRLLLSVYKDGSGQFVRSIDRSMPDFLAFERATAIVCGGVTAENKGIFDVSVPDGKKQAFGISCKMASANKTSNFCFMELSNSKKKFDDEFARQRIDWRTEPFRAGIAIVNLVTSWHEAVRGDYDLRGSRYLILSHDSRWENFQLSCFPLDLKISEPTNEIQWCNEGDDGNRGPSTVAGYITVKGKKRRLWQLYQNSGGQLKYYPLREWADWHTEWFKLEEPPHVSLESKARSYFPDLWPSSP